MLQLCEQELGSCSEVELHILKLEGANTDIPNSVAKLINKYKRIFEEPKFLPPARGLFDHRIPLEHVTNPIGYHS